jgi:signal transduction histidine kinase/GAF domain-containing protein/BarA-like signal transduction histidine kinase
MNKKKSISDEWNSLLGKLTPMLLSEYRASSAIQKSIDLIQKTTGVCRVYVFDLRGNEEVGYLSSQKYESCREGVDPQIENQDLQDIPMLPDYKRWMDHFLSNTPVIGLVRDFPADERELLEAQEIKSLLILPIQENGKPIAMAGFDDTLTERIWDESHLRILQDAIILIGSLLVRERHEKLVDDQRKEREKIITELVNEQEKVLGLTENVSEGLWIRDPETFELTFVNKTLERMFGIDQAQFKDNKGNAYLDFAHPDDRESVSKANQYHFETKEETFFEWRMLTKTNEFRWVRAHLFTVRDRVTKQVRLHCGVLKDITDDRNRIEALEVAKQRADELNRLKSNILMSIRHEFRTPITGILGFADLINMTSLDQETLSYAQNISTSANRLHNTLDALLDYAILDAGIQKSNPEWISVEETIADPMLTMEHKAREKGFFLRKSYQGIDKVIFLDKQVLYTVVRQIFDNAVKFTSKGEISIRIEVKRDLLSIHVTDTGCGIPESFKSHIFEPFRQGSEGLQRTHEGNGLGLPIVKRYLDLVNGAIHLDPNYPNGTQVRIEIPLPHQDHTEIIVEKPHNSLPRIMYVEDNSIMQLLVRETLSDYDLDITSTAEEALTLISSRKYDLFLVDINLGAGMNGIDFCRIVRSTPGQEHATILAVTASSREEIESHIGPHGFNGVISKPFGVRQLLELTQKVLSE